MVDDGSTDRTPEILARLAERIDFLRVLDGSKRTRKGPVPDRLALAAEVRAFNQGLDSVEWRSFTHIAKLDGDTELPPHYFERLLGEFERDPAARPRGRVVRRPRPARRGGGWKTMRMPTEHHVPGTLKCYSLACFTDIGGMQERLGWDTIDETYARMRGYRTRAFGDLIALHHRPFASADGTLRGRARHGECAYIATSRSRGSRCGAQGRADAAAGALRRGVPLRLPALGRAPTPRVEDPEFRLFVRRELRGRMLGALRLRGSGRASARPRPALTVV